LLPLICYGALAQPLGPEWKQESGYSWRSLTVRDSRKTGFERLSATQTGVVFTNRLDEWAATANRVLELGSGVAAGDYDGDGLADLFFCSLSGECKLYKNLGGFRFKDVTAEAGIVCTNYICRGAVFADIDGDRHLDLLISTSGHGVLCFRNDGNGHFTDFTPVARTVSPFGATTLALADIDGNGTLDLYVADYRTNDIRDAGEVQLLSARGQLLIPPAQRNRLLLVNGQVEEYGDPDLLYTNDGSGHFTLVPWVNGRFLDEHGNALQHAPFDWGLTAAFRDINGDGFPDLYVCNDYWTPDRIWINDGAGHFRAMSTAAIRHTSASSMGVDFADIDRDGHLDIFVLDMLSPHPKRQLTQAQSYTPPSFRVGEIFDQPQINRNTLLHNRGDNTFEEIAEYSGVTASGWSWQPLFLDVDLDGFPDVLIMTGHRKDVQDRDSTEVTDASRPHWVKTNDLVAVDGKLVPFQTAFTAERVKEMRQYSDLNGPIVAYRNLGNLKFEDQTESWGLNWPAIRHGAALVDLDNDGDLDLVVNVLNGPAEVWENVGVSPRVAVELVGLAPNTAGIGAQITLRGGAVPSQTEEVVCGGKYLSCSQTRVVFAAGSAKSGMGLDVRWRNGKRSHVSAVSANRLYRIDEHGAQ
jgi:hypothetical protein